MSPSNDLDRDPPPEVKRYLRQEVNFGCPVQGCCDPCLSWHHFDPPWTEEHHHDPKRMIALCLKHHKMADENRGGGGNFFSRDHLRQLKANPNSIDLIRQTFPWFHQNFLIRLGGCYAVPPFRLPSVTMLGRGNAWHIGGSISAPIPPFRSLLEMVQNQDGFLDINLDMRNQDGTSTVVMKNTSLEVSPHDVYDISVSISANRVQIWTQENEIGLELSFSRKTLSKVEDQIKKDEKAVLQMS